MPAITSTLLLDYVFDATGDQTYTYTILGEIAKERTADETITLNVGLTSMNKLLTYSSSWEYEPGSVGQDGYQPLPAVALRLKTVVGSVLDALTHGLTGGQTGAYPASESKLVVEGDNDTSCKSLVKQFQEIVSFEYTNGGITCDHLSLIPVEAIEKFVASDASTDPLSEVVGDLVAIPLSGETGHSTADDAPRAAIQALFEQAVNAGLVKKAEDQTDNSDRVDLQEEDISVAGYAKLKDIESPSVAATALPVYGAQWAVGQTLAIYVKFALTKTRAFDLSTQTNPHSSFSSSVISFGGVQFDASAMDTEVSAPVDKIYQIVLRAVAD
jgi:hypothetical protein